MSGNSFCMLLAGFFVISLFGMFTAFGTSWSLVDVQYADRPLSSWILVGALTHTSVTMKVRLPGAEAFVLLVSSDETLLDNPDRNVENRQEIQFDTSQATSLEAQYQMQTVLVQDLLSNTKYFYKVRENTGGDTALDDILDGSFQTPAPIGTRFNYTIATAGCAMTGSRAEVFSEIEKTNPLMFLHLGDLHYEDISSNDMSLRVNAISQVMAADTQRNLYRSTSFAYMWDDHDWLGNDSDGVEEEEGAADTALQSYQLAFPHYPLPAMELHHANQTYDADNTTNATIPVPVYQAFTVGTIRYIVSDLRSEATPDQIYSETQANWLREELSLAANYDFVIWVTTKPWIGEPDPTDDAWYGYVKDRQELSDYISNTIGADDGPQNLLAISADAHMVAFDDGTNTYYGQNPTEGATLRSFPILQSGSLDRVGSAKGNAFTEGCYAYELQRTHQFSTVAFELTDQMKCIKINTYRNIQFSYTERELLFSKRLCNKIFEPTLLTEKEGTCEITLLWEVNEGMFLAAIIITFTTVVMSWIALKCSNATNLGDFFCKSCLVTALIPIWYLLPLAVGIGTYAARDVQQFDVTPIAIVLLCQTVCSFFYLGIWWAFCTTQNKRRIDENDPAFLDVEPNFHIQNHDLDITTRGEDDQAPSKANTQANASGTASNHADLQYEL